MTNKGEKPVTFTHVTSTCGCTVPKFTKDPISPGKTGTVELVYNSSGRPGSFNKSATVRTSDGHKYVLKIKGEVYKKTDTK